MIVDLKTMAFFITSMIAIYWLARSVMIVEIENLNEFPTGSEVEIIDKALEDLNQMEN